MDDYNVKEHIGGGAFGNVYKVVEKKTRITYAMKKIDVHEESIKWAEKEIDILKKIKHPNIVKFVNSFFDTTNATCDLCIVMELCSDGDLEYNLARQAGKLLEEFEVINWFKQICHAVKYLHVEKGIVHRDLKPLNIFLTKNSKGEKEIRVGDFGIAGKKSPNREYFSTQIGTVSYCAPEIFTGEGYKFEPDMWSLGCILYKMITLQDAFFGQNVVKNIIDCAYPKKLEENVEKRFSTDLKKLIPQLIVKERKERVNIENLLKKTIFM